MSCGDKQWNDVYLHDMSETHLVRTIAWIERQQGWEIIFEAERLMEDMNNEVERRRFARKQHGAGVVPF